MKLLFLSQHYWPEPCDTRTSQLAALMASNGHDCTALTTFPNYPFGKVYPRYQHKLVEREQKDGVTIVRVPMFTDHSKSRRRRASSYLSFCASSFILGSLLTRKPDVLWIHHPPLTTAVSGLLLAKLKRAPFVLEIHDLWPETLMATGMLAVGRVSRLIGKVCDFVYSKAAKIIVTSPGMKDNLVAKGVPTNKIEVIYQWTDEATYRPTERDEKFGEKFGLKGKVNLVFGGNQGIAQDLDTILDAANLLSDVNELQFVLIGKGVETSRLLERAERESIDNVRFVPHQPHSQMPNFYAWADALVIHLRNEPLFAITVPSKTQTYLASGKPILCGVAGDTITIIEDAACGIGFIPGLANSLADTVREFLTFSELEKRALAVNARSYFEGHFSQRSLSKRYEDIFASVSGLDLAPVDFAAMQDAA